MAEVDYTKGDRIFTAERRAKIIAYGRTLKEFGAALERDAQAGGQLLHLAGWIEVANRVCTTLGNDCVKSVANEITGAMELTSEVREGYNKANDAAVEGTLETTTKMLADLEREIADNLAELQGGINAK